MWKAGPKRLYERKVKSVRGKIVVVDEPTDLTKTEFDALSVSQKEKIKDLYPEFQDHKPE